MKNPYSFKTAAALILALAATNCEQAVVYSPANIPDNQRPFFGTIKIFNHGKDVTQGCVVTLTDDHEKTRAEITLGKSGWTFSAVDLGRVYLSSFNCVVGDGATYDIGFATRDLAIDLPGSSKIAYFGAVRIDISSEMTDDIAKVSGMIGGMASGIINITYAGGSGRASVENRLVEATAQYNAYYSGNRRFEIAASIAGPTPEELARRKAREDAVKARAQIWATWADAHKDAACADASAQFKRDANCIGAGCKTSLDLSDGYRVSCPMNDDSKIALHQWRRRWEKETGHP